MHAIPSRAEPFRGEAFYLPYAGRVYLPIRKNGHTAILNAIQSSRQPWIPVQHMPLTYVAPRIAMWRNPYERIEAAHATLAPTEPFEAFVHCICAQPDAERDPHVMSQWLSTTLVYPQGPDVAIHWDFPLLARALGLESIPRLNGRDDPKPQIWSGNLLQVFHAAFRQDFHIWSSQ